MSWALVLGGAQNVYDDLRAAIDLLGEPDLVVGVKDIWIEYPRVDHVATYHLDRIPKEIERRRTLGYPDPKCFWSYASVRTVVRVGIPVKTLKVTGGSSGLLGALVGIEVADKAVLAGIPLDPTMPHFHNRKHGKPWKDGAIYIKHWREVLPKLLGRVKSMSGRTRELLGEPTREWLNDGRGPTP